MSHGAIMLLDEKVAKYDNVFIFVLWMIKFMHASGFLISTLINNTSRFS